MMRPSHNFLNSPNLDYEAWREIVRLICGPYTPRGVEPKAFAGRANVRGIFGFRIVELSCNALCLERTHEDIRDGDAKDHYYALFQMTGQSKIIQNDRKIALTADGLILVDASRPVTLINSVLENGGVQLASLQLPRWSLISHQGFEPECPSIRYGTPAVRVLRRLLEDRRVAYSSDIAHMRLAIYDLMGVLFVPPNQNNHG
jgi:AraC family transcriptional activator of tynA and feaB